MPKIQALHVVNVVAELSDGTILEFDKEGSAGWMLQGSSVNFAVDTDDSEITMLVTAIGYDGDANPLDAPEPVAIEDL